MTFSLGIVGAGQFAGQFATLFNHHPDIDRVYVVDLLPERAAELVAHSDLAGTFTSFEELLASEVDAIALFTQRWTHGPLAVRALRAGKHVYSAVPMATSVDEIAAIIEAVEATGLVYMMGETSYYNPATVFARNKIAEGAFGQIFYAEGDYVHDMDLGFYDAYKFSGGESWKSTASYPPMWYSTHSIGGVIGAWASHATSVSCIGVHDNRSDGVFDTAVSQFGNDFSNATALFEMNGGGSMRINEFRRVGYPSHIRESRFRFFGTEGSFEETVTTAQWLDKDGATDVSSLLHTEPTVHEDDVALKDVSPPLRSAFVSGYAAVHDTSRLPHELKGLSNGHEGSHHFLVDDFARAVTGLFLPPVNAWQAARYTLPGLVAHQSALQSGARLTIPDFGAPAGQP